MAQTSTEVQEQVLPLYQEEFLKDLLKTAKDVAGEGQEIPDYEDFVAALTPNQLKAIQMGTEGIGSYKPLLDTGTATLGTGVQTLKDATGITGKGVTAIEGAMGAYDPQSYKAFMDPYQEEVISKLQDDLDNSRLSPKPHFLFAPLF